MRVVRDYTQVMWSATLPKGARVPRTGAGKISRVYSHFLSPNAYKNATFNAALTAIGLFWAAEVLGRF
jgi:hypothetical protein